MKRFANPARRFIGLLMNFVRNVREFLSWYGPFPMPRSGELLNLLTPIGNNRTTLSMLVQQVRTTFGIVPFVGAGMSKSFGFPQWDEFLEDVAQDDVKKRAVRERLAAGQYEEAAQDLMDWHGGNAFHDAVDHTFGPTQLEGKKLKGAVCLLPRLAKGPVLTTNFDQVLEQVFAAVGMPFLNPVILGMKTDFIRDAFNLDLRYLVKLHGDAADRTDRVLTLKEYEKHYRTAEPLLPVLKFAMQRPLLFLGCSLKQDRTMRVLESLRDAMGKMDIVHYAIMEAPKEGKVLQERQRYLSERGIRVVWFPTGRFDLIGDLLKYLADRTPRPPIIVRLGVPLVVLLTVIFLADFIRRQLRDANTRVQHQVQKLESVEPHEVPNVLTNLARQRNRAMRLLRARSDKTDKPEYQLRYAVGLATLGDVDGQLSLLLNRVVDAPDGECMNIARALEKGKSRALAKIAERTDDPKTPADQRVRFATLALFLGDQAPLQKLATLTTNPVNRTAFIHGYPSWPGDPQKLARILTNGSAAQTNSDLRSALCAAVGLTNWKSYKDEERKHLRQAMEQLYTNALDGGTHSAAFYALNRWESTKLPSLTPSGPQEGRDWFVNSNGMTMIRVPGGEFSMGESGDEPTRHQHPVKLTEDFFIADREVTVAQFLTFVAQSKADGNTPREERIDWDRWDRKVSPTADCPVHQVSWFAAVKFCNWLGRRHGLSPCYRFISETNWECDFRIGGYRLPTEAEWERASRSLSEERFAFGNADLLVEYGYAIPNSRNHAWPGGSKLPNGWGLFDMHGNVSEWCYDWYTNHLSAPETDPHGPDTGPGRVHRGGNWYVGTEECSSFFRVYASPEVSSLYRGFRVVLVPRAPASNSPSRP